MFAVRIAYWLLWILFLFLDISIIILYFFLIANPPSSFILASSELSTREFTEYSKYA